MSTRIKLIPRTTGKTIAQSIYDGDTAPSEQVIWYRLNNDGSTTKMSLNDIHNSFNGELWKLFQDETGNYYADLVQNAPKDEGVFRKKGNIYAIPLHQDYYGSVQDNLGLLYTTGHWMLNGPLKIYKQDEWNEMTESEHEEIVGTPYTEDYEAPPYDAVYYDDKPYLLRTQEYKLPEITAMPSKESARFVKLLPRKFVKQFSEELENLDIAQEDAIKRFLNIYDMAGSPGIHDVEYTKDPIHLLGKLILGSDRPQYDRLFNLIAAYNWNDVIPELAHPVQSKVLSSNSILHSIGLGLSNLEELLGTQTRYYNPKHFEFLTHNVIEPYINSYIYKNQRPIFMDENNNFIKIPYKTWSGLDVDFSK